MKRRIVLMLILNLLGNAWAGRIVSDKPWHDPRVIRIWEHKKDRFVFKMCNDKDSYSELECTSIGQSDYGREELESKVTNERWKAYGVPLVASAGVAVGAFVFLAAAVPAAVTTAGVILSGTYLAAGVTGSIAGGVTSLVQTVTTARNPIERIRVTQFLLANDKVLETNDLSSVQDLLWETLQEIEDKRVATKFKIHDLMREPYIQEATKSRSLYR